MKMIFALMMFVMPFSAMVDVATDNNDTEKATVEITYTDGTTDTFTKTVDQIKEMGDFDTTKEVLACTITLADGSCSCTGPTCAAARRCFFGSGGCATARPQQPSTN